MGSRRATPVCERHGMRQNALTVPEKAAAAVRIACDVFMMMADRQGGKGVCAGWARQPAPGGGGVSLARDQLSACLSRKE